MRRLIAAVTMASLAACGGVPDLLSDLEAGNALGPAEIAAVSAGLPQLDPDHLRA